MRGQGRFTALGVLHTMKKWLQRQLEPDTFSSLSNLAGLFHSKGEYERALPLYEECLAKSKRALGDDRPDTKRTQRNRDLCARKMLAGA